MVAIAIDGPAGAGKSTIARALAKTLSFIYVDTGALYRSIGLYAVENCADPSDITRVVPMLDDINVELIFINAEQRVILNGRDVSEDIRRNDISMAASAVSAIPKVREFLFDLQRNMAKENNVVMDGRDIGTVVLPWAQLKIFLTATPEERARRRFEELSEKGQYVEYSALLKEVIRRDENDTNRIAAPLKQAPDALLIDTTGLTLSESTARITQLTKERLKDVL